jgi:hypothetical protein
MTSKGINYNVVMEKIETLIVKTIISGHTPNTTGVRICNPNK